MPYWPSHVSPVKVLADTLHGLGRHAAERLVGAGVSSLGRLAALTHDELSRLQEVTGVDFEVLTRARSVAASLPRTVNPHLLPLARSIKGIGSAGAAALYSVGVRSLEDLMTLDPNGIDSSLLPSSLTPTVLASWRDRACLQSVVGIGPSYGKVLSGAGVQGWRGLLEHSGDTLRRMLSSAAAAASPSFRVPSAPEVAFWQVQAAALTLTNAMVVLADHWEPTDQVGQAARRDLKLALDHFEGLLDTAGDLGYLRPSDWEAGLGPAKDEALRFFEPHGPEVRQWLDANYQSFAQSLPLRWRAIARQALAGLRRLYPALTTPRSPAGGDPVVRVHVVDPLQTEVPNVHVRYRPAGDTATPFITFGTTDLHGSAERNLDAGAWQFQLSKDGYLTKTYEVTITAPTGSPSDTVTVDLTLDPSELVRPATPTVPEPRKTVSMHEVVSVWFMIFVLLFLCFLLLLPLLPAPLGAALARVGPIRVVQLTPWGPESTVVSAPTRVALQSRMAATYSTPWGPAKVTVVANASASAATVAANAYQRQQELDP